jgi:Zn-dependent protease with chaperone function
MALLYLYRVSVFIVSAASHYGALVALLWYGQEFAPGQGAMVLNPLTLSELAVLAGLVQICVFLLMISPVGSWFREACLPVRRMSKREAGALEPLLQEIMQSYQGKKPARLRRVRLRMEDNPDHNAYAFGKNAIALTSGMFRRNSWNPEIIKGVLAHELGHLHHRDTRIWQYVGAAGGVFSLVHGLSRLVAAILTGLAEAVALFGLLAIPALIFTHVLSAIIYVIRLPEMMLGALSVFFSRGEEYRADRFAADIAGVRGLIAFLESLRRTERFTQKGFLIMKHKQRSVVSREDRMNVRYRNYPANNLNFLLRGSKG